MMWIVALILEIPQHITFGRDYLFLAGPVTILKVLRATILISNLIVQYCNLTLLKYNIYMTCSACKMKEDILFNIWPRQHVAQLASSEGSATSGIRD